MHRRGLDQGQGVDVFPGVTCELQRDGAAVGVADEVDLSQLQRSDEVPAVSGIADY